MVFVLVFSLKQRWDSTDKIQEGIKKILSNIPKTRREATDFLSIKTKELIDRLSKTKEDITESELVKYWKGFINGLPEYHQLVKAGKIDEVNNILETLDIHNEAFKYLKQAIEELKNENKKR